MRFTIEVLIPRELETSIGAGNINVTLGKLRNDAAKMIQNQLFHMAEQSAAAHKAIMEVNELNFTLNKNLEAANLNNQRMFDALQMCQNGLKNPNFN